MSIQYQGDFVPNKVHIIHPDADYGNHGDSLVSNGATDPVVNIEHNRMEPSERSSDCEQAVIEMGDTITPIIKTQEAQKSTDDTDIRKESEPYLSQNSIDKLQPHLCETSFDKLLPHEEFYSMTSLNQMAPTPGNGDDEQPVRDNPLYSHPSSVLWRTNSFDDSSTLQPPIVANTQSANGIDKDPATHLQDDSLCYSTPVNSFSSLPASDEHARWCTTSSIDFRPIPTTEFARADCVQSTPCTGVTRADTKPTTNVPLQLVSMDGDQQTYSLVQQKLLTEQLSDDLPFATLQTLQNTFDSDSSSSDQFSHDQTVSIATTVVSQSSPPIKPPISPRYTDLESIAQTSLEPDYELEAATGNMVESQLTDFPSTSIDRSLMTTIWSPSHQQQEMTGMHENLNRCSPAQVVAATGGAPAAILHDLAMDVDNSHVNQQLPAGSLPGSQESSVWHRVDPKKATKSSEIVAPVIDLQVQVHAHLQPTSAEEVDASSEVIFGNFMAERYKLEVTASARASTNTGHIASADARINVDVTPPTSGAAASSAQTSGQVGQLSPFSSIPQASADSMEAIVARNLAQIGDEINRLYGSRLDRMIKLLPEDECPLQLFSNVARVLFTSGRTNWGQVVTLFYFGYRLVIRRVRSGIVNAFRQVCSCLINFCRKVNIFKWIAQQGGWLIMSYLRLGGSVEVAHGDTRVAGESAVTVPSASSDALRPSVVAFSSDTPETTPDTAQHFPESATEWSVGISSQGLLIGPSVIIGVAALCIAFIAYRRFSGSR